MIYDYAVEPELAATWHDRSKAYAVLGHMGHGKPRVVCIFPSKAWEKMVFDALNLLVPDDGVTAAHQNAKKNLTALIHHIRESASFRNGKVAPNQDWIDAAVLEHRQYPFGGILLRSIPYNFTHFVGVDQLGDVSSNVWDPPAPSVYRQPKEFAKALSPLLRSCSHLKFVDPYFDAGLADFRDTFAAFLEEAQNRRPSSTIRLEIHLAIHEGDRRNPLNKSTTDVSIASEKIKDFQRHIPPMIAKGSFAEVFVWSEKDPRGCPISNGEKLHNRYVLTNIGSIAAQTGLDRSHPNQRHTDDLTILSKEQHENRWAQYDANSKCFYLVTGPVKINGTK